MARFELVHSTTTTPGGGGAGTREAGSTGTPAAIPVDMPRNGTDAPTSIRGYRQTGEVRRALAALATALAVAVATATAGGSPAAGRAQGPDGPIEEVQALLDRRAAAVRDKDRKRFLETVDPSAPAAFKQAQARHFDGLTSMPIESFSLRARIDETGDLSAGVQARYGRATVVLPETRQSYRITGADDRDAVDRLWLTYVLRDGSWYVAADADLESLGLESDRQLWDFGPVVQQRTDHVLVLSHPEQAERAAAIASMAEEAVTVFDQRWDTPWSGRVPVVLPGSVDELERLLESTVDLDKFVAFAGYGVLDADDGRQFTAPRIYVQDARLSAYTRAGQVETLVHELLHFATATLAGPFVPGWVHEGVADWVATGMRAGERRPGGGDALLPRDYEFSSGSQAAIVRAYRESRSAVSVLAARKGPSAPAALFAKLGALQVAPGSVDHNLDAALRESTGMTLGELESIWAARGS